MTIPAFRRKILDWYAKNGRVLPWRKTHDPYKILVSEIMLQQTQVSRVIPKYKEFLKEFPTAKALSKAPDSKLLTVWSGLGYWRRARFLKAAAIAVTEQYNGKFPQDIETLKTLPGIGPYTAGAVACFAFNSPAAFVDTNIRRVYLHFFFADKEGVSDKKIMEIAQKAVWKEDPRSWHWALFDYGAMVLKDKKINRRSKHYNKQSEFIGSFRSFRTQIVKYLLAQENHQAPRDFVIDLLEDSLRKEEKDYSAKEILDSLVKDSLIKENQQSYYL